MWSEARELSAGRVSAATIAGAVLLGVCAAAVAILAAVLHLTLFFGFWRRTVWGRCRRAALVEPAQQELQLLMEPLPSRAMTAYAAGLVVLFVCLTVIAGSIVYQLWVAPSAKPLYVPQFGSG